MSIEDLPHYIKTGSLKYPYFLTVSRDLFGKWSAGYIAFTDDGESVNPELFINSADTLDEVVIRMTAKLARYNKRHENQNHPPS